MFEFLSKLVSRKSVNPSTEQVAEQILQKNQLVEDKQKIKEQERQAYLQKINANLNNEDTLFDLLSECDFADGRYLAAQHIVTPAYLERALQVTRKIDKRAAKLMQARLDEIRAQEQTQEAALALLQQADVLLSQELLLANQLIDLDKQFAQLNDVSADIGQDFKEKRDALQERLNVQLGLQRELLQLMQEIDLASAESSSEFEPTIQAWKARLQSVTEHQLARGLPKHLLPDAQKKIEHVESLSRQLNEVKVQSKLDLHVNQHISITNDSPDNEPEASQAPDTEVAATPVQTAAKSRSSKQVEPLVQLNLKQIEALIVQLEVALDEGKLGTARQIERELRHIDAKQNDKRFPLSADLKERLNSTRNQLTHWMSWAKWSGDVSRDELIKTAEQLTSLSLAPQEIVETVSALRDQWRQMDSKGGGAPKELWLRFDAACSAVYAPAAQHFQAQAELRKANLIQAQALLAQFATDAQHTLNNLSDWKSLHVQILAMQQAWKKIGQLDRKEKARVEREFDQLLNSLKAPLAQRQSEEVQSREKMIAEVLDLDSAQKSSIDQVRSIQQRWQMQAASVPMPRKEEQVLWERFRAACDSVFEKKRAHAESADLERQTNLVAKQDICNELSNANTHDRTELRSLIESANSRWKSIGYVPRAHEQKIEQDFQNQLLRLKAAVLELQKQEHQQKSQQLLRAIALCQKLEFVLLQDGQALQRDQLIQEWNCLQLSDTKLSKVIQSRFARAMNLSSDALQQFAQQAVDNAPQWDEVCMHLEILLSVESPSELARERLKKQVEVLKHALKSGGDQQKIQSLLAAFFSLHVEPNTVRESRLQNLLAKIDADYLA
jgi:hypothetical protein